MDDLLQQTLDGAAASAALEAGLGPATSANGMVFLLIAGLGLAMALVYVPVRVFLTITERSRRYKLLQRIRRTREALSSPLVQP